MFRSFVGTGFGCGSWLTALYAGHQYGAWRELDAQEESEEARNSGEDLPE